MEFSLNKTQVEIQKAARKFAKKEFDKERSREWDRCCQFPQSLHQMASGLGFTSIHIEDKFLGGGFGYLENTLMAEELCRSDSTSGIALMLSTFGSELLQTFGSEQQKNGYLPALAEGSKVCGTVFPAIDPSNLGDQAFPVAQKMDLDWVVNARLHTALNCTQADFFIIPCLVEDDDHKNWVILVVEASTEGLEIVPSHDPLGMRMSSPGNLKFHNVQVPGTLQIGETGRTLEYLSHFKIQSMILVAAMSLGIGQGCLERAVDYTKNRVQFKCKLAEFQVIRHKLAEMAITVSQARSLTYQAAWEMERNKKSSGVTAIACLSAMEAALFCSHGAIQLLGGYGFCSEYEVERFCRDAKMLKLFCGPGNLIMDDIACSFVGKIKN